MTHQLSFLLLTSMQLNSYKRPHQSSRGHEELD